MKTKFISWKLYTTITTKIDEYNPKKSISNHCRWKLAQIMQQTLLLVISQRHHWLHSTWRKQYNEDCESMNTVKRAVDWITKILISTTANWKMNQWFYEKQSFFMKRWKIFMKLYHLTKYMNTSQLEFPELAKQLRLLIPLNTDGVVLVFIIWERRDANTCANINYFFMVSQPFCVVWAL